jgi:hypothetical protein
MLFFLASPECLRNTEGSVGPDRHGGERWVEPAAAIGAACRLRHDAILAAAERVAVGRRRGVDERVVHARVVVLMLDAIAGAAVRRRGVHGRRVVRRQREAQPAASPGRRVAPAGAAAAHVLAAAVAGHFVLVVRPAGTEEEEEVEVLVAGRRDD